MISKPLKTSVRAYEKSAVIDLMGDINGSADDEMNAAFSQALSLKPNSVVLNFSGVEYINSTGIALIVGLLATARQHKVDILTLGLSDHYREIFEITRLSDFMKIVEGDQATKLVGRGERL
ncbi:MAG: STAS domain-containing protein [Chloroflexota bacterium]